jgi:hypothetical protein
MVPLFQMFEFSYADGSLFYDRSGALARRLQEALPGLTLKNSTLDQRDFALPAEDLELFFGIAISRIQTASPGQPGFARIAAGFLQSVAEVLELSLLKDFHFGLVLGRPCVSGDEAQRLMWPLVPEETKTRLQSLATPRQWRALQGEFIEGNLGCQTRIAIIDMVPHPKLAGENAQPAVVVPHITFHFDYRGLAPVPVSGFDAAAFIQHVCDRLTREIVDKLAPHLA